MPKDPDEQAVWEVIRRNPRLDKLITYYLRCEDSRRLLAEFEDDEVDR